MSGSSANYRIYKVTYEDPVSDEYEDPIADEYEDPILEEYKDTPLEVNATKLRFVSVIFRHGDRTPESRETYSNDPYKNDTFYPIGRGELTNAGKERAYQLGLILRKLYNQFLGTVYYQPHIYARSTFITRCKMTLQLVLAALFPPSNVQKWNNALPWQPMNVKYASVTEDRLLMSFKFPEFEKAFKEIMDSQEIIEKSKKYRPLMKEVSAYTGDNITDIYQLAIVHVAIHAQLSMNLTLPKTAHILHANEQFLEATRLVYSAYTYNEELIRFNGGVLLRKIIEDMNEVIKGTLTNRKINLFSGHDLNVIGILQALHIKNKNYSMPDFTSSVILELREKNNRHFVRVLYYYGIPRKLETLVIPGCEILCPYDRFLYLTSTTIATNIDLIGSLSLKEDLYRN